MYGCVWIGICFWKIGCSINSLCLLLQMEIPSFIHKDRLHPAGYLSTTIKKGPRHPCQVSPATKLPRKATGSSDTLPALVFHTRFHLKIRCELLGFCFFFALQLPVISKTTAIYSHVIFSTKRPLFSQVAS